LSKAEKATAEMSLWDADPDRRDALGREGRLPAVGDLFSAHDFDIKLDLDARLPRKDEFRQIY
jgi:hypothetical protein